MKKTLLSILALGFLILTTPVMADDPPKFDGAYIVDTDENYTEIKSIRRIHSWNAYNNYRYSKPADYRAQSYFQAANLKGYLFEDCMILVTSK